MRYLLLLSVACSNSSDPAPGDGADPTTPPESEDALATDLPQGLYAFSLSVAPVGGLIVPFQVDVETLTGPAGTRFSRFDLRATNSWIFPCGCRICYLLARMPPTRPAWAAQLHRLLLRVRRLLLRVRRLLLRVRRPPRD